MIRYLLRKSPVQLLYFCIRSLPRSTWECPPERSAFTRRRAPWKLIPRGAWNEGGEQLLIYKS